jgi:hypothetical protein
MGGLRIGRLFQRQAASSRKPKTPRLARLAGGLGPEGHCPTGQLGMAREHAILTTGGANRRPSMGVLINGLFQHVGLERKSPSRNCGTKFRRAIAAVSIRPTNATAERSTSYHTIGQYEGTHKAKAGSMAK